MKRYALIAVLAMFLLCGCVKKESDWFNRFDPDVVYMELEGGEFELTGHSEIVYSGIYTIDEEGKKHKVYYDDYLVPDTSSYPYWVKTSVCRIEHISARKMNVTVLPTEQRRKIFIYLGGIDDKGITHRTPGNGINIYQGYPEPAK